MVRFFTWRRVVGGFVSGFLGMFVWAWLWDSIGPGNSSSIMPLGLLAKAFIGGVIGSVLVSYVWRGRRS